MENTNFIPANQLPVAEGDEVSVLCVENGELKQKSASGLGGGNVVQINVTVGFDAEGNPLPSVFEPITAEMVEKIVAGAKSGHAVTINMRYHERVQGMDTFTILPCEYTCSDVPKELGFPTSVIIEVSGGREMCGILDDGRVMNADEFDDFLQSVMPAQEGDGE